MTAVGLAATLRAAATAALFVTIGCVPRGPALGPVGYTPTEEAPPVPERPFVHRDIPIVVHVLSGPGEDNPTDEEDVMGAVAFANDIFEDADISFYVHAIARRRLGVLHHNDDGGRLYAWAEVRDDAIAIDPALAAATFDPGARATRTQWLVQIAARQPRDRIDVLVFTFTGHDGASWGSNCASPFPHNDGDPYYLPPSGPGASRDGSKGIYCTPGSIPGRRIHALAHEFGHYLAGLFHTFEVTNREAIATEGMTPSDYFDLVYAPDAAGTGILTFTSRAGADSAGGVLKPIDASCDDCAESDSRKVLYGTMCDVRYRFVLPKGAAIYDSVRDTDKLGGMAFAPKAGSPRYGINVMSYLFQDPERTPCDMRLSRSQIRLIHRKLQSRRGHRDLLGAVPRARLATTSANGRPAAVPTPK